jgi:hypothetical protein
MALKPRSRCAVLRDSRRGIHAGASPKIAVRILHERERARWTEGAGACDAHLNLRLHVGALRQQRPNHLQVAALRGGVERRPSILRRRREHCGKRLPPPSSRPSPAGPHQHTPRVALRPSPCLRTFTRLPPASRPPRGTGDTLRGACAAAAADH